MIYFVIGCLFVITIFQTFLLFRVLKLAKNYIKLLDQDEYKEFKQLNNIPGDDEFLIYMFRVMTDMTAYTAVGGQLYVKPVDSDELKPMFFSYSKIAND